MNFEKYSLADITRAMMEEMAGDLAGAEVKEVVSEEGKVTEVVAPDPWGPGYCIFLAGSIEQGKAEDWQSEFISMLKPTRDVILLNPRRRNWDSTWPQSYDHPEFKKQVDWELDGLARADLVVFNFDPTTKSPVSLLELGLYVRKAVVCCPAEYWRAGNVEAVCRRFNRPLFHSLKELAECASIRSSGS